MTFTIVAHTKFADFVFEFVAAYHTDAMNQAKAAMLAEGFVYGEFTIEFFTDAEAAEYFAAAA